MSRIICRLANRPRDRDDNEPRLPMGGHHIGKQAAWCWGVVWACMWRMVGVAMSMLMLMCVACYVMDMCVWYWYTIRTQSDRQKNLNVLAVDVVLVIAARWLSAAAAIETGCWWICMWRQRRRRYVCVCVLVPYVDVEVGFGFSSTGLCGIYRAVVVS